MKRRPLAVGPRVVFTVSVLIAASCSKPTGNAAAPIRTAPRAVASRPAGEMATATDIKSFKPTIAQLKNAKSVAQAVIASDGSIADDDQLKFDYDLLKIDDATFAVLTTAGYKDETQACHVCSGFVHVDYVVDAGSTMQAVNPPVTLKLDGGGWGQAPDVKRTFTGGHWRLTSTSGYSNQGCTSQSVESYDLLPQGVRQDRKSVKTTEDCSNR